MISNEIRSFVDGAIAFSQKKALYSVTNAASHTHNGIDSPFIAATAAAATSANASGPGTATSVPGSLTATKIPIASADFANGITYDSTNKRFRIVTAGQYSVTGFVYYSNPTTANVTYQTMVYLNGTVSFAGYFVPPVTGIAVSQSVTKILNLAAGDYLELYAQTNAAGANIVSGTFSYLCLAKC